MNPTNQEYSEREWKLFRAHQPQMREALCRRINAASLEILQDEELSEHERYLKLFAHVRDSDEVVASCFNDWRRSRLSVIAGSLAQEKLIPDNLWNELPEPIQERIRSWLG
ncbi:MAG: hypothetical protein AAF191_11555 [Verrucomicrobiota bacterium]